MNITYEQVSKRFKTARGTVHAVVDLDLTIEHGEFFIFLGPSGCGKSTVLNLTAGLEEPSSGTVRFGERVAASPGEKIFLDPSERNVAMVFQSYALYPHMNVFDNIAFPLRAAKGKKEDITTSVRDTARILEIAPLLDRKPKELSGGQRQRVAMARALVRNPSVFLLDEPLSNLDAQLRISTRAELKRLQREMSVTTLYVTHDQTEAMTLGDRVALLKEGRLVQVDTPREIYQNPATPFAATFVGSPPMNLLPARLESRGHRFFARINESEIILPGKLRKRAENMQTRDILVGIRPERIEMAEQGQLSGSIST
ncbi:MAG: ABC transporter ATP-binding protein, partial [Desulfovibrionales bacterium]